MTEQTLAERLAHVKSLIDAAIAEAGDKVESGPDNPKISHISTSVRAFSVNSKDLGSSWSPKYHDWKWQYGYVRELLERHRFATLEKLLEGRTVDDVRFAPEVIEFVKGIVGDLPSAGNSNEAV